MEHSTEEHSDVAGVGKHHPKRHGQVEEKHEPVDDQVVRLFYC